MRNVVRSAVAVVALAVITSTPPANASNTFTGNVKAMAVWGSATVTAFTTARCQPVAALQGLDGLVVLVGSATKFTITASSDNAAGYGVHFYDGACRHLGATSNIAGNEGTDRYFTVDKAKTPGTVHAELTQPATWVAITAGWGVDVDFTVTWS